MQENCIKIADFGFARIMEDPNKASDMTKLGTPYYAPP
jgi:serine/threonine protein kinase